MKIAILGAGNIGGAIGKKWAARGHDVVFGVRDPGAPKVAKLLDSAEGAAAAPLDEAVGGREVILLAIPGQAVASTVAPLAAALDGKILVDATNKVGEPVMNSLSSLREYAPEAQLFRAFNHLGWENFAEPVFGGVQADLFYCGDEGEARPVVETLIADVGLRPVYIGNVDQAPLLDALTSLWFTLALRQGYGRHLAFKMLTEEG